MKLGEPSFDTIEMRRKSTPAAQNSQTKEVGMRFRKPEVINRARCDNMEYGKNDRQSVEPEKLFIRQKCINDVTAGAQGDQR